MLATFQQYISRLKSFFFPSHRPISVVRSIFVVALAVVGVLVVTEMVFAQASITTYVVNGFIQAITWIFLGLAKLCVMLTIFCLEFFIKIASYNGYSEAPPVLLGWYMMRDIANMFFVIALLIIAFGTILGLDNYEWKKTLGKLIIAAILINFSKLIAQFIIDISHVFTITFLNAISAAAGGNLINMFNFDDLFKIAPTEGQVGSDNLRLDLLIAAVLILVFSVIALVTIFSYVLIMAIRMVVLWVAIILAPLAYILSVLPPTERYASEYWSQFINYVMVAPVMVFFLWIAFASFGSGNIAEQIGVNPGNNPAEAAVLGLPREATTSLTEAGTWQNMSSFIIAIVFLIIGIERVQSLNVRGGGFTETALSWGKNAIAVGTGFAAGRWLAQRAGQAAGQAAGWTAKEVGYKVPLVGGAALQEYGAAIASTYRRKGALGVVSGGRASGIGGAESKIRRSDRAKNLESKGALSWIAARVIEPAERAAKRKEDWTQAAERLKTIQDESYSTSSTRAGQAKLTATVELKKVEEKASAKAAAKVSSRLKEARDINSIYNEVRESNPGLKTSQLQEITQERYLDKIEEEFERRQPGQGAKERAKVERLLTRDGGVAARLDLAGKVQKEINVTVDARAEDEEANWKERRYIEEQQAVERDSVRRQQGLPPIHLASVREKHQKELEEAMSGLNFRELTRQAGLFAKNMKEGLTSPDFARAAAATLTYAMKQGSETGMTALGQMLANLGYSDEERKVDASDLEGTQRLVLSALLGEKIDRGAPLEDRFQRFFDKVGGEEHGMAILKNLDASFKSSASDGAVNVSALLDDQEVDPNTGRIKFKLATLSDAAKAQLAKWKGEAIDDFLPELKSFIESRLYFAEETKVSLLTGVEDFVSSNGLKNRNGEADQLAIEQLKKVLSSAKSNTQFHPRFVTSINNLYNQDQGAFRDMLKQINEQSATAIQNIIKGYPKEETKKETESKTSSTTDTESGSSS